MVQLLKAALVNREVEDLSVMLKEEILNVDQQLLQVEKATGEISGEQYLQSVLLCAFVVLMKLVIIYANKIN